MRYRSINAKKYKFLAEKYTSDVLYFRRMVYLMKTAKGNAYIMYIFHGKIELLSIHAIYDYFKMH